MPHSPKLRAATAVASLFFASSLSLAATITSGNLPQPGDQNILFNSPSLTPTGTTVQGHSNQSHFVVDFTSTSWLQTPSGGQARIDAGKNNTFTNLSISLNDPGATFTSLIFNLYAKSNGSADITLFGPDDAALLTQPVSLRKNGNNYFTILADPFESFSRIVIAASVELSSARHFRLGGAAYAPPPLFIHQPLSEPLPDSTTTVPAPASAWGGAALLALYAAYVTRTRRARLAAATIT